MGHLVLAFQNTSPNDSYVTVDPATGTTRSLGIAGYLDAGFNSQLTKAAVVRQLSAAGGVPSKSRLSVMPLGKGRTTTLWTFNSGMVSGEPEWNASGSRIAIGLRVDVDRGGTPPISPPVSSGLWVVNVDDHTRQRVVAGGVGSVAWSPNGRTLAYVVESPGGVPTGIDTVSVSGKVQPKRIATLTDQAPDGVPFITTLSWSPDGKTVVVCNVKREASMFIHTTGVETYPATTGPPSTILGRVSTPTLAYQGAVDARKNGDVRDQNLALMEAPTSRPSLTMPGARPRRSSVGCMASPRLCV